MWADVDHILKIVMLGMREEAGELISYKTMEMLRG